MENRVNFHGLPVIASGTRKRLMQSPFIARLGQKRGLKIKTMLSRPIRPLKVFYF
jgi:hypothetical protein